MASFPRKITVHVPEATWRRWQDAYQSSDTRNDALRALLAGQQSLNLATATDQDSDEVDLDIEVQPSWLDDVKQVLNEAAAKHGIATIGEIVAALPRALHNHYIVEEALGQHNRLDAEPLETEPA